MKYSQLCKLFILAAVMMASGSFGLLNAKPLKKKHPIQIKKVTYCGVTGYKKKNFTALLQKAVGNAKSYTLPNKKYNSFAKLFGNPKRSKTKTLTVTFSVNGEPEQTVSVVEGESITLEAGQEEAKTEPVASDITVKPTREETKTELATSDTTDEDLIKKCEPSAKEIAAVENAIKQGIADDKSVKIVYRANFSNYGIGLYFKRRRFTHCYMQMPKQENNEYYWTRGGYLAPKVLRIWTGAKIVLASETTGDKLMLCFKMTNSELVHILGGYIEFTDADFGAWFFVIPNKENNPNELPIIYKRSIDGKITKCELTPCEANRFTYSGGAVGFRLKSGDQTWEYTN